MKQIGWFVFLLISLLSMVACSDDGIYFTQDEIVQGDIITGKQIELKGNVLVVYTEEAGSVNVQGAKGQIHAVSSDEKVVTVSESSDGKSTVFVTSVAVGKAVVTVNDEEGNSSSFTVEVKDVEELWTPKSLFVVSSEKLCVVEGVSAADSAAIVADVLSSVVEAKFVIKERSFIPSSVVKRLYVYDSEENLLFRGLMKLEQKEDGLAALSVYYQDELLASYQVNTKLGSLFLIKELTDAYQDAYPQVTKVQVYLPIKTLQ